MDEREKNPINILTDALAEMTARAIKAEEERDEAIKNENSWYENWKRRSAELEEKEALLADAFEQVGDLKAKLDDMTEKYNGLQTRINDYIKENMKGEQENG